MRSQLFADCSISYMLHAEGKLVKKCLNDYWHISLSSLHCETTHAALSERKSVVHPIVIPYINLTTLVGGFVLKDFIIVGSTIHLKYTYFLISICHYVQNFL